MYAGLRQKYYWRNMWTDCRTHCLTCDVCQRSKKNTHYRKSPLMPIKPNDLWERWHIDYLKMPTVNGFTRLSLSCRVQCRPTLAYYETHMYLLRVVSTACTATAQHQTDNILILTCIILFTLYIYIYIYWP